MLTGLVAVAASAPFLQPYSAMALGLAGGLAFSGVSAVLEKLGVDDTMDGIAVHLGGGLVGLVLGGVSYDQSLLVRFYGVESAAALQSTAAPGCVC